MAAGAASGGAAGGAKHVANVPGQQGLERLDGLGSRELLEQVGVRYAEGSRPLAHRGTASLEFYPADASTGRTNRRGRAACRRPFDAHRSWTTSLKECKSHEHPD